MSVASSSPPARRTDLALVVCVHLTWGMQPVLARWLQRRLNPFSVVCATQLLSACFAASAAGVRRRCTTPSSEVRPATNNRDLVPWSRRTWWGVAFVYGLCCSARAITNFVSSGLTAAWHVQGVAMFAPFTTAAVARLALGERLDWRAWPCLAVAVFGALLVAQGERARSSSSSGPALEKTTSQTSSGSDDDDNLYAVVDRPLAGCALQALSMVFSASARVLMKMTADRFTSTQLMGVQYATIVTLAFSLTTLLDGGLSSSWEAWGRLEWRTGVALLALSFVIQWAAAESQVVLIRRVGPALYTVFQPSRVAVTVLVGSFALREPVKGAREWCGLVIIIAAVAWYLAARVRSSPEATGTGTRRVAPAKEQRIDDQDQDHRLLLELPSKPKAKTGVFAATTGTNNGWHHPRPFPPAARWSVPGFSSGLGWSKYAAVPKDDCADQDVDDRPDDDDDDNSTLATSSPSDALLGDDAEPTPVSSETALPSADAEGSSPPSLDAGHQTNTEEEGLFYSV